MTLTPFLAALSADGPAADLPDEMNLYGWLVGSWEMQTQRHLEDGSVETTPGEIHFAWVLQGRAIKDLWIRPTRPTPTTMYGTTLRVYDPAINGWHIIWSDPLNQDYLRQIGRREGKDIVQVGADSNGVKTRWRYTRITPDSFRWFGEKRAREGDPWTITYEHSARRTA